MTSGVVTLLLILSVGAGLCIGWLLGHWTVPKGEPKAPKRKPVVDSDEIERDWARPQVPGRGRPYASRYDGMTDAEVEGLYGERLLT